MSWQRIFEVARGRGLPIIVTDLAGREPLVVMPLEEYERVSDGALSRKPMSMAAPAEKPTVIPIKMQQEEQAPLPPPPTPEGLTNTDVIKDTLSLEERFYLEPTDEDSNI